MAGQAGLSRPGAVTFLLVITINLREGGREGGRHRLGEDARGEVEAPESRVMSEAGGGRVLREE